MRPTVTHVEWVSRAGGEAIVTLSDGEHVCACFGHPFVGKTEDVLPRPLAGYSVRGVELDDGAESMTRIGATLEHEVVGTVQSTRPPIVSVGEILVETDCPLPGDIVVGQRVRFSAARLDL
jgi:hypothetical protein